VGGTGRCYYKKLYTHYTGGEKEVASGNYHRTRKEGGHDWSRGLMGPMPNSRREGEASQELLRIILRLIRLSGSQLKEKKKKR